MATFGQLLGQEIRSEREARGWTQLALAERTFADPNYERRIRDYETGRINRPQCKVYQPLCDALKISQERVGRLKTIASNARQLNDAEIAELVAQKGDLDSALSDLQALAREQLESLAVRFGISASYSLNSSEVVNLLQKKADEYRGLREEIDGIGESNKQLWKMKTLAQAAIAVGDLIEVERLLSQVQVNEKEQVAETGKLRAKNALLMGKVESAYQLFVDAADGFSVVAPARQCELRVQFSDILKDHVQRFGGVTNQLRVKLIDEACHISYRIFKKSSDWREDAGRFFYILYKLNIAKIDLGFDTLDNNGEGLISSAIDSLMREVERLEKAENIELKALMQKDIGLTMLRFGQVRGGAEAQAVLEGSLKWLERAATSYDAQGKFFERDDVQSLHRFCVAVLAARSQDEDEDEVHCKEATVAANRSVLEEAKRRGKPTEISAAYHRIGTSEARLGTAISGPSGQKMLVSAIAHLEEAVSLRRFHDSPRTLARSLQNLAGAFDALVQRSEGKSRATFRVRSAELTDEALSISKDLDDQSLLSSILYNRSIAVLTTWLSDGGISIEVVLQAVSDLDSVVTFSGNGRDQVMLARAHEFSALARDAIIRKHKELVSQDLVESALQNYEQALSLYGEDTFPKNRKRLEVLYNALRELYEIAMKNVGKRL